MLIAIAIVVIQFLIILAAVSLGIAVSREFGTLRAFLRWLWRG